ncbi:Mucin and cadherin-like protein [Cricetulus griseus]|uniref:Mucin and cadherin-like protein n=1 Tax=Cricetulus griseus TaxID=10029 RepID=G3I3G0_CRIGR|nr:Mucin and cadherin-like protein [Cricetulus griseus]
MMGGQSAVPSPGLDLVTFLQVTVLRVFVVVQDVNDNAPEFPFTIKKHDVAEVSPVEPEQVPPEYGGVSGGHRQGDFYTEATAWLDQLLLHPQDTRVGSIVIPGTELEAKDADKDDTLIYTLQEVTPDASSFFSLVGQNNPALRLEKTLDFYKIQSMTLKLLARDTLEKDKNPSHTATATLVLNVLPADLRTPWFLPCSFSDGYSCIQAQYHGVVPIGYTLPSPLILSPGPIYAVDGDQGINQPIIYSIVAGNTDDTFIINADSGNLTMAKSIPRPMTFTLVVRADQVDMARYSITQAIVDAGNATGTPLQFSRNRYHGTVVLGSKAGTEVKDRTSPSEILRIQAQYPGFPDLDSATTYQITNSSDFKMEEDVMLTTVAMEHVDTFYVEVEATNTVTMDTATTVVEIQVTEQEPPITGTQGEDQRFSTVDMAVLGGVLGALLLLALICLCILIHKHYRHRFNCCSGKVSKPPPPLSVYDNLAFFPDHKASWLSTSNPQPQPDPETARPPSGPQSPMSSSLTPPSSAPPSPELRAPGSPKTVQAGDSPLAVRSILTKERRPEGEGGYKAVWFGKDIREEADVVVLNEPAAGVDSASASGSEGSDEDSPNQSYI